MTTSTLADESTEASQRQAVFVWPVVGYADAHEADVWVEFCSTKISRYVCVPLGNWNFDLTDDDRDALSRGIQDWVLQRRYDQLFVDEQGLGLQTRDDTLRLQSVQGLGFDADLGLSHQPIHQNAPSESRFTADTQRQLRDHLAPLLKIQQQALAQRYAEHTDAQRQRFLQQTAKSTGVPVHMVQALLNSQYVMLLYVPKIQGDMRIRLEMVNRNGRKEPQFTTTLDVPMDLHLHLYQLDASAKSYEYVRDFQSQSGGVSESQTTRIRPTTPREVNGLFHRSLQTAIKASFISLSHRLKTHDAFRLKTPITWKQDHRLAANVGDTENVRVDGMFEVWRSQNGRLTDIGAAQVTQVGESQSDLTESQWRLTKGDALSGDMLVELPEWTGAVDAFRVNFYDMTLNAIDGIPWTQGKSRWWGLTIQSSLDLGYAYNDVDFANEWIGGHLGLGFSGDPLQWQNQTYEANVAVHSGVHYGWQWWLGSGFNTKAAMGLGLDAYSVRGVDSSDQLALFQFHLMPKWTLGYQWHGGTELQLGWERPLGFSQQGTLNDNELSSVDFDNHSRWWFGLQWNTEDLGTWADWYTP